MRPPFVLPQGRTIRKLLGEAGEVQKKNFRAREN